MVFGSKVLPFFSTKYWSTNSNNVFISYRGKRFDYEIDKIENYRKRNLRRNNVQSYNHISLRKKFLFHCLVSFICVLNLRILKTIQYQTREIKCGYRGLKFD